LTVTSAGFIPGFVYPAGETGSLARELQGRIAQTAGGHLAEAGPPAPSKQSSNGNLARSREGVIA
jgi:hypothetical protein